MMQETFALVEEKIAERLKCAKKQKKKAKKAKKTKNEHYFKGQKDVLEQVLLDLKILRDQFAPDANEVAALTVEGESADAPKVLSSAERLLNEALSKEIIIRKTSYYLHDSFPSGKAHGKRKALELLEQEDLAAAIQQQLAEANN